MKLIKILALCIVLAAATQSASAQQPLTLKLTQQKLGNVFLTNEPVAIEVNSDGATVHWMVRDFAEKTIADGTIAMQNGQGIVTVPVRQPGYYTLHVTAARAGAADTIADTSLAVLTPLTLSVATNAPFGVMTHFAQGWDPDMVPLIALAGAAHNRDEVYWDSVEPKAGEFAFPERYESYMRKLRQAHVWPLVPLTFANKNYDGGQTPYTAAGFAGYARYAQEVLRHYGGQINAVEIWNEYNGSFCQGPACTDRADTYTKTLQGAYTAVKQLRPDVTVLGGATAGVPLPFFEKMFKHGALKSMDAISIHPYRYGAAPEGIETEIERLQSLVKKYHDGRPKPIWVTEVGWLVKPSEEPGDLAITESDQAKFLVRGYTLLLSAGVQQIYWYLFRDYAEFATMGLVHSDTSASGRYTPKPAYVAFATMTRQLNALRFVRREPTVQGIYSLVFHRADQGVPRETRVLWSLAPQTITIKTKAPLVRVDMMGAEGILRPANGQIQLELSDAPVYLSGDGGQLPPAATESGATTKTIIADSELEFSETQGKHGWYYGYYEVQGNPPAPADFKPLPRYRVTDWREEWVGDTQWLSVTSTQQHPGAANGHPVWAVRRWVSTVAGRVRLAGSLSRGTKGDGTNFHILVDGREVFKRQLGGGQPLKAQYDLVAPVHVGSTVDLTVDTGPGTNTDYDETQVSATIFQVAR